MKQKQSYFTQRMKFDFNLSNLKFRYIHLLNNYGSLKVKCKIKLLNTKSINIIMLILSYYPLNVSNDVIR